MTRGDAYEIVYALRDWMEERKAFEQRYHGPGSTERLLRAQEKLVTAIVLAFPEGERDVDDGA